MKKTYGDAFQRAFQAALEDLETADRLLLKQRFRHRMTVEQLGTLHAVHASTISRRVDAARERLVKATRTQMMRELDVGRADVSSILRLIESELESRCRRAPAIQSLIDSSTSSANGTDRKPPLGARTRARYSGLASALSATRHAPARSRGATRSRTRG